MSGKTIIVTGASDGIGAASARQLSAKGHRVLLVGRSREKLERVATEAGAEFFVADFSRLDDVRQLASALKERVDGIDVLANNAGSILGQRTLTGDGHEQTWQVNYLAPVLLTHLLKDDLLAAKGSVVNTSSLGTRWGKIDLDDLDHEQNYTPLRAYNDAKLAITLFARALSNRYRSQGLSSVAFHPGGIASNFGAESPRWRFLLRSPLRHLMTSAEKGGSNLSWFIEGTPDVTWKSGAFYELRALPKRTIPLADDDQLADALWIRTAEVLAIPA